VRANRPGPATRRRIRVLAAAVVVACLAAACGDDDASPSTDTSTDATVEGAVDTTAASGEPAAAFPVTIEHAFGETVVEAEPVRVATVGFASADAAIALGVVPVAIPFATYGADDEGVLPWIREALEAAGEPMPTILPDAGASPPFEAIAAADPDVILAVYSGISESDYALLTEIAPTIAYPDVAWSTPWRDTITIVGEALGRPDAAAAILADIDDQIAAQAQAHPELAGKTVAQVWDSAGTFYVYEPADARVEFTLGLGLELAPSVAELATDESTFYFTLSYERLGELTSDILVSYADTPELSAQFLESDQARLMEQVQRGAVAEVVGPEFIASVSPPTALSLTWGLDEYVALLSDAAQAADAAG
jgi:iron complex transport system substrate-binding protein